MIGVLEGFGIIGVVIAVGYLIERLRVLGDGAQAVLSRTVYFVATPCLLFEVLASADVSAVLSPMLVIAFVSAVVTAGIAVALARFVWRVSPADTVLTAMGAGYLNSNNIGLPVAVFVLGSATHTAPVLLIQLAVFMPVIVLLLDHFVLGGPWSVRGVIAATVRNPLVIGSVLGFLVSLFRIRLPPLVMEPAVLIGGASVPLMLMGFGMSLHGGVLRASTDRGRIAGVVALKLLFMPFVAWMLGALVFHLDPRSLYAAVVMAGLPTAQNLLNTAQRFETGTAFSRDVVLVSTVLAVPVLVGVAGLLGA